MSEDQSPKKKNNAFTIMKDDSTDGHGGYGVGSISLENVSPVIIDPNEDRAFVDMGAMHARSEVERRVKFLPDKDAVPNGKLYWIVWVTVDRKESGPYYAGVAGSEIRVDRPIKRAYKSMPEHVTHLDKSMKGKIIVDHMDDHSKKLLRDFLKEFRPELWENSTDELKNAL
ncbi:YwhD family protein [Aquibacillus sp. 3ASR75-11]|uniref:YwhD family protein n=1 Tax=Terrihalobacillus insolitus TaxID=2950438 RepID=A0A9X4AP10_9BACI|nr:YwhD family protein [Terrihalobacillus insolitus]MDC3414965.1 YwhD family protein [Terrihalobacillus insolitus]MDC3425078.1 YwhD family protein [Terrihalobacillus insolitus]